MTSKADKMALLRMQQMLDRNRDKPGAACPGPANAMSWATLRRVVELATKHARECDAHDAQLAKARDAERVAREGVGA